MVGSPFVAFTLLEHTPQMCHTPKDFAFLNQEEQGEGNQKLSDVIEDRIDRLNRLEGGDEAIAVLLVAPGDVDGLLGRLAAGGGDGCADLLCFLGCHDQAVLIGPSY
jgi:hypothetical protein